LRYTSKNTKSTNKIHRYTVSMPTYDLFDTWGHTLETIEVNSTFRVFIQNPNGLSVYQQNHLLRQDLQLCHDYGAGGFVFLKQIPIGVRTASSLPCNTSLEVYGGPQPCNLHILQIHFYPIINQVELLQQFVKIGYPGSSVKGKIPLA
jgi:hypothetical protein